ncbi:hypothetical protein [Peribacillus sp. SI8-4]|uniref:hypothetical protein n=1 Tax=Peribacillus sp. SI8-4 TaxID=3048009 RepID=UPI002552719B|nr:hypothetical protein [Peribacillus sp. SI8-4]
MNFCHKVKDFIPNKKAVLLFGTVFFVCLFSIIMISGTYIQSVIDVDNDKYQTITFRLSIFFLGSIITMSVFVYNSKQKISSLEFLNSKLPYMMLAGIVFSIFSILTVPTNSFLPKGFQWDKLFTTDVTELPELLLTNIKDIVHLDFTGNISDILSLINLFAFIVSLIIFGVVLYNFIYSFYVKHSIEKNYNKIIRKGNLRKYFNVKSIEIKAKLSNKQCESLEKKLEFFYQHLIYVNSLNDSTLIKTYLEKWQEINSTLILLIFHADFEEEDKQYREKLYNKILYLTRDLILATSNNISLKEENTHLINFLVNSLPTQEQYFDNSDYVYETALKLLCKEYFKQIFGIFNHLYESSNKSIYTMILNKEVHFLEKIQSLYKQAKEYKREDLINKYVEDLFVSALFKSISTKSDDLTTIIGLLFITQNNYISVEEQSNGNDVENQMRALILQMMSSSPVANSNILQQAAGAEQNTNLIKKITRKITKITTAFSKKAQNKIPRKLATVEEKNEVILNSRILENLIIAIAKACEIENYGAAGYLVKRVCNHVTYSEIEDVYPKLKEYFSTKSSKELSTSVISLNPYSLKYCLDKAIFLLLIQLAYDSKYTVKMGNYKDKMLISNTNIRSIIASLKDRKKEYNLPCIENDSLDSYKKYMRINFLGGTLLFINRSGNEQNIKIH